MARARNVSRMMRLVICTRLPITSIIPCASGETHLGFQTKISAAASAQRVESTSETEIVSGSLAGRAGLKIGDEILELNGHKVRGVPIEALWHEKQSIGSEDTIRLRIRHANGVSETVEFPTSSAIAT